MMRTDLINPVLLNAGSVSKNQNKHVRVYAVCVEMCLQSESSISSSETVAYSE